MAKLKEKEDQGRLDGGREGQGQWEGKGADNGSVKNCGERERERQGRPERMGRRNIEKIICGKH